jgi:hypothetical protein
MKGQAKQRIGRLRKGKAISHLTVTEARFLKAANGGKVSKQQAKIFAARLAWIMRVDRIIRQRLVSKAYDEGYESGYGDGYDDGYLY